MENHHLHNLSPVVIRFSCVCVYFSLRYLVNYAHPQTVVIRPLIFPSLPGSPGVISNRAALTSRGSCSSHRGSPLISIDFFFSSAASLIKIIQRRIIFLSWVRGTIVSLSQSGRLYNYTGQWRAIQFFTRFSSAEVIPLSFTLHLSPSLSVFPFPPCCQAGNVSLNRTPTSSPPLAILRLWSPLEKDMYYNSDRFLSWSCLYYHRMTFWKAPTHDLFHSYRWD